MPTHSLVEADSTRRGIRERLNIVLNNSRPVQEEDISGLIELFTGILTLQHWVINYEVVEDSKLGKSLMQVTPTRDRNLATIRIRRSLLGKPTKEFGPLLLHEMMHLVLDPIIEEYSFQSEYEVSEQRIIEYNRRLLRCFERTVEHLTYNVARMITKMDPSQDKSVEEISAEIQVNLLPELVVAEEMKNKVA